MAFHFTVLARCIDIRLSKMLSTLSIVMGVCASGEISEQEKAEQERHAAAEQRRLAAEQRRLVVEASEPVRLLSTSPEFELAVHEANTVLEVLEIRAVQMGLPKAAAVWLKLEFSDAIISHHKTPKEAGLCDQAEISVQGEDEAKAKKEQADKVNIHDAAKEGKAAEVQLVLDFYPDRVNAKNTVRQSLARLSLLLTVCGWMDSMGRPLCTTQQKTIGAKWLKS